MIISSIKAIRFAVMISLMVFSLLFAGSAMAVECKGKSSSACKMNNSCSWVKGYTRSDGVKVSSFCRATTGKSTTKKKSTKKSTKQKAKADTDKKTQSKKKTTKKKKASKETKKTSSKKKSKDKSAKKKVKKSNSKKKAEKTKKKS